MNARFILSLVVGASLLTAFASAQGIPQGPNKGKGTGPFANGGGQRGGPGGGQRGKWMADEMKKLHLTAAQKKKVDAYNAHSMRAMQAAMKAHPGDRAAMGPMMKKMREERTAFMKKVLTGKQFKILDADMKARRSKMGGGRGGPGGGRGGAPRA